MAIHVKDVEVLKEYFSGVVARSEHHAPNVSDVIYTLLGLIVLKMDNNSDIEVRGSQGAIGNLLWFTVNQTRYAFRYEHADDTIEIREGSFKGRLIKKVDNKTSISELKDIFTNL